jgi:hypothetical protein
MEQFHTQLGMGMASVPSALWESPVTSVLPLLGHGLGPTSPSDPTLTPTDTQHALLSTHSIFV